MVTLRYMFWVMALFLLSGCALNRQAALEYRWDVLAGESSGGSGDMIYAADRLVGSSGTGLDISGGYVLNNRAKQVSEANFTDNAAVTQYKVFYRDRFAGNARSQMSLWHSVQDYSTVRRDVSFIIESQTR